MTRPALARSGAALRSVNWAGVARVALVGAAAAAVVQVAATRSVGLDLAAAVGVGDDTPVTSTALTTRVAQACPGAELSGIDGVPDQEVPATVTAVAGPSELLPAAAPSGGSLVASADGRELLSLDARPSRATTPIPQDGPVLVSADAGLAPAVAAAQEWRLDAKELRGLATAPCGPGSTDQWLLAGGAGPGRQERLVLSNPGANPVTASVAVHGAAGPLGEATVRTVAPGGRVSLLLDARHGAEERPAVHVTTDGAGVQATLTDTWVDGSTALGAETTGAAAPASTTQVLPGVVLGTGPSTLRVVAPGEQGAVVRVDVLARDGFAEPTGDTVVSVEPGAVAELPLTDLAEGVYGVVLRSDVPVVGAVLSRVGDGAVPGDFAWAPSTEALTGTGGAALPATSEVGRTLQLVSTGGSSTAELTTVADGVASTRVVSLLSERTATVSLDRATSVWVRKTSGSGQLRGSVLASWGTAANRMLSSAPLRDSAVSSAVSRAFPLP